MRIFTMSQSGSFFFFLSLNIFQFDKMKNSYFLITDRRCLNVRTLYILKK